MAGITALVMLSAFVALRARGIANVIRLAAATAVIYAFVNAVTKSGVDLLIWCSLARPPGLRGTSKDERCPRIVTSARPASLGPSGAARPEA